MLASDTASTGNPMKAAILNAYNEPLEIAEIQIDKPGPREVLVKTEASGVCHSDLHIIEGKIPIAFYTAAARRNNRQPLRLFNIFFFQPVTLL